jgi:uncharacterized protein (DUF2062 family)/SAM-dependent methyltransferase
VVSEPGITALHPLRRLRAWLREVWQLIWRQHRSPGRVAAALLLGFVVGCTPLFGVQLVLCIALCRVLGLNLPIMYAAANISVPPLVPLIGWASVELGTYVATGHSLSVSRADFARAMLPKTLEVCFWAWLRGGVLLGTALGAVVGGGVYALLRLRHGGAQAAPEPAAPGPEPLVPTAVAPAVAAALAAAARRYARAPRRFRYYARAKYRLDPCYKALCARIPAGAEVVDLGCGLGMLAVALAELGGDRRTLGVDWDQDKLAAGKLAAADLPQVTLQRGDLREQPLPACDVITLVDVLHYYDPQVQTQILQRAAAALRPDGQVLIRETDPARRGGARLTRLWERLMVRLGWNRGPSVRYRPLCELHADLQALGLATCQLELAGATHPGNVLVCARKPGPLSAAKSG